MVTAASLLAAVPALAIEDWTPAVAPVTVTRVVDGDTIKVVLDGLEVTVRLIGVDTPETVHPAKAVEAYGKEASDFTRQALEGTDVWLELDVGQRDRYGRLLAYVWTSPPVERSDDEVRKCMHNAVLLLSGYGRLMTIAPNVRYVEAFREYEAEARTIGRGLWGDDYSLEDDYGFDEKSEQVSLATARVNLNTASLEELQRIVHIGPVRAEDIVAGRPWHSVDDLLRIDGIGQVRLAEIKSQGLAYVE
jgi:micrococcal nuclease